MISHAQPLAVCNYYNTAFKEVQIHYLEILIQTATPLFKKCFFHYSATKKNISNFSQVFDNCSHSKALKQSTVLKDMTRSKEILRGS